MVADPLERPRDDDHAQPSLELLQKIWGRRGSHRDRTVDVFVRRLRDKVDRSAPRHTFIQTRYGVGYKLEALPKEESSPSGTPTAAA